MQNHALYLSQDNNTSEGQRKALLLQGRAILGDATVVMQRIVSAFRVPAERISSWRQGPTVYPYGYVWAAKSL